MNRATETERMEREAAALAMLQQGYGSAHTAATLAATYGVSLRQARRYVECASLDLLAPANPAEFDRIAMVALHRYDLIAGRAMAEGDTKLAIQATRAAASLVSQYRRAIEVPTRHRLPNVTTSTLPKPPPF